MKKRNLWCWFLWVLYGLGIIAFFYYLRNTINLKNIVLIAALAIIFSFFNVYIMKERKRTINSENKTNIQQFKVKIWIMISFVLLFTGLNFFFNAHCEKDFWLYLVFIYAYIIWLWLFTYDIGFVILAKINPKRESIFLGKFIELIFECATNLTVIILLVSYAFSNDFSISLERIIKTVLPLLALIIPVIKNYNFIISEYYEYEKQEQAKKKQQKQEKDKQEKEKYQHDFYNYE